MATTYEKIATTTLGSAAASITLSSIPATYTDLRVVLVARTNNTGTPREDLYITFNSDSSSLYSTTILAGQDASAFSFRQSNQTRINAYTGIPGTSGQLSLNTIDVFSYAGSTFKTCLVSVNNDQNTVGGEVNAQVGLYRSTSAITSITFTPQTNSIDTGSTLSIYGILKA
jgi:hypothetical protein